MIASLLAGLLAGGGLLLWLSPGSRIPTTARRRRSAGLSTRPTTARGALAGGGPGGRAGVGPGNRSGGSGNGRGSSTATRSAGGVLSRSRSGRAAEVRSRAGGDRAASSEQFPALPAAALVELTACQLDAGLPLAEALGVLAESCAGTAHPELARVAGALRLGLPWESAWPGDRELSREMRDVRDALEFTAASATASASVLRGQAELVRRAQYRRAERAAEALAVQLVLPLGLCFLPAFMCWGVVPVLMSLLPRVFGS